MRTGPTTDPQHELFDLYDPSGKPLGQSKPRGEVHRDGDWHRSLHLWLWTISERDPLVIFQRRSMTKDTWPGALDVAVGGHFRSGESLAETLREADEEIGLHIGVTGVVRLGRRFHEWRSKDVLDREINEAYAVHSDMLLTDYLLHPQEVDALVQIRIADGLLLFRERVTTIPATRFEREASEAEAIVIGLDDFVDVSDDYALKALTALQALASGSMPAPFEIQLQG